MVSWWLILVFKLLFLRFGFEKKTVWSLKIMQKFGGRKKEKCFWFLHVHAMADIFWLKNSFATIWLLLAHQTYENMGCYFHYFPIAFVFVEVLFRVSVTGTCQLFSTWPAKPAWFSLHGMCVCSLHGICVFITWHVYVQYMSCFGSKKSKLSFAKPVGLQFSCCHITSLLPRADVMLPCTKHMHTPTYCMGIFHTWLLLNVLAQVLHVYWQLGLIDLCCLFYMPWAHQVPMSLQNHTCSNGGNLKSFALVIIHLEPTCSVML